MDDQKSDQGGIKKLVFDTSDLDPYFTQDSLDVGLGFDPRNNRDRDGSVDQSAQESSFCMLEDGSVISVEETAFPGIVRQVGEVSDSSGGDNTGVAKAVTDAGSPTQTKRGGVAGGGKSGQATSPASRPLRNVPGKLPQPVLGTASPGGVINRLLAPFGVFGTALSAGAAARDFEEIENAPECKPIA